MWYVSVFCSCAVVNVRCAHGDGRIASTGSTVNGNNRAGIHYIGRATCTLGRLITKGEKRKNKDTPANGR